MILLLYLHLHLKRSFMITAENIITPKPTLCRMPTYLRFLKDLLANGSVTVSCTIIANALGLEPTQIRKDLAMTGIVGKPKLGYYTSELIYCIEHFLGWDLLSPAFLVGAGKLGSALLAYGGFRHHGIDIVAAFDTNPSLISMAVHGKTVYELSELTGMIRQQGIKIGIITVPAKHAQSVANQMVDGGVKAIWNFTTKRLLVPDNIIVENEDLFASLAVLCGRMNNH